MRSDASRRLTLVLLALCLLFATAVAAPAPLPKPPLRHHKPEDAFVGTWYGYSNLNNHKFTLVLRANGTMSEIWEGEVWKGTWRLDCTKGACVVVHCTSNFRSSPFTACYELHDGELRSNHYLGQLGRGWDLVCNRHGQ